ncbi:hypothetical protein RIF23_08990 [Lipingzhangella sp. LS1_29]|uniref:Integral membrane protein n=1 Tax=Lipingzhangella rawalii TaxID=2055835 RepID=A0ABU2H6F2_9ACTN|nr:hypothetical protein [Lipingzhangella rawalii]
MQGGLALACVAALLFMAAVVLFVTFVAGAVLGTVFRASSDPGQELPDGVPELLSQLVLYLGVGLGTLLVVLVAYNVCVAILTFIHAARFSQRRSSLRVWVLAVQALLGGVTVTVALGLQFMLGDTWGAWAALFAVVHWTTFGLLLTGAARSYFHN